MIFTRTRLRLRPFDTSSPEGRSNERYRRAALTTVTTMAAQALGIFTGLAWIRLSLSYLGEERYGLWIAIGSLVAWANLADMGLARGMQNHLSQANGQDDRELASRYVSTGLVALGSVALILGLLSAPVVLLFPWATFLNLRDPALVPETRQAVASSGRPWATSAWRRRTRRRPRRHERGSWVQPRASVTVA